MWVVDDRGEYCSPDRFPRRKRQIVGPVDTSLSGLEIDPDTYCLIVHAVTITTRKRLYHLAETNAAYVGLIGSRRKIRMIFDDPAQRGIARDALLRVFAPSGSKSARKPSRRSPSASWPN